MSYAWVLFCHLLSHDTLFQVMKSFFAVNILNKSATMQSAYNSWREIVVKMLCVSTRLFRWCWSVQSAFKHGWWDYKSQTGSFKPEGYFGQGREMETCIWGGKMAWWLWKGESYLRSYQNILCCVLCYIGIFIQRSLGLTLALHKDALKCNPYVNLLRSLNCSSFIQYVYLVSLFLFEIKITVKLLWSREGCLHIS